MKPKGLRREVHGSTEGNEGGCKGEGFLKGRTSEKVVGSLLCHRLVETYNWMQSRIRVILKKRGDAEG